MYDSPFTPNFRFIHLLYYVINLLLYFSLHANKNMLLSMINQMTQRENHKENVGKWFLILLQQLSTVKFGDTKSQIDWNKFAKNGK